jgi:hypothetical protein
MPAAACSATEYGLDPLLRIMSHVALSPAWLTVQSIQSCNEGLYIGTVLHKTKVVVYSPLLIIVVMVVYVFVLIFV